MSCLIFRKSSGMPSEAIPKLRGSCPEPRAASLGRLCPPRPGCEPSSERSPAPAAPPGPQLAQIRSHNRRSPSGPGTRAARSHGSQPKQVIWLPAYAVCPEGPSAAAPAHLPFHRHLEAEQDAQHHKLLQGLVTRGVTPSIHPTSFQHCQLLCDLLPSARNTPKGFCLTKSCCPSNAVTLESRTMEILHPMQRVKGHICHFPRRRSSLLKFRVSQFSAMNSVIYFSQ